METPLYGQKKKKKQLRPNNYIPPARRTEKRKHTQQHVHVHVPHTYTHSTKAKITALKKKCVFCWGVPSELVASNHSRGWWTTSSNTGLFAHTRRRQGALRHAGQERGRSPQRQMWVAMSVKIPISDGKTSRWPASPHSQGCAVLLFWLVCCFQGLTHHTAQEECMVSRHWYIDSPLLQRN